MVAMGHFTGSAGAVIINSQSIMEMIAFARAADVDRR